MSEVMPLYRPKLKQEWRVSRLRKHRTVGGVRRKCQSSSQEIVQNNTEGMVEGCSEAQPTVERYPGGGDAPPAPLGSMGAVAGGTASAVPSETGGGVASAVGGASSSVAGSTLDVVGGVPVGAASSALLAGATGASVSAGSPPAAGRPGSRTSM